MVAKDGMPFSSRKGHFRFSPSAGQTMVNWTLLSMMPALMAQRVSPAVS